MPPDTTARHLQQGFAVVTGIFILVALAALGAAILTLSTNQQVGEALDVRGMRAYQAARAGADWAAYTLLDPNNSTIAKGAPFPAIPANAFVACSAVNGTFPVAGLAGSDLAGFNVNVTCSREELAEAGRHVYIYQVSATATAGTLGATGYVERRISLSLAVCRDPLGDANAQPPYACI